MYVLVYRGHDSQGKAIVWLICPCCGYSEEHFTAQGEAKRGKPCDRCRK